MYKTSMWHIAKGKKSRKGGLRKKEEELDEGAEQVSYPWQRW